MDYYLFCLFVYHVLFCMVAQVVSYLLSIVAGMCWVDIDLLSCVLDQLTLTSCFLCWHWPVSSIDLDILHVDRDLSRPLTLTPRLPCPSYKEESEAATESDELIEMEASQSQDYSNNDAETIEAVIYSRVGKKGGRATVLHVYKSMLNTSSNLESFK